ncbi:MAG: hypothetical protein ACI9R3_002997 [Verrucomicrobiales bacterium]|jgi:hypothetical protein
MRALFFIAIVSAWTAITPSTWAGVVAAPSTDTAADHWAFQRIERPAIPQSSAGNAIDALIEAKWRKRDLFPAPPAADDILLRRLYLDLTGLPPSPRDREQFLADSRPDRIGRLISRLLASPRYAEHWGRHWMDIWRYSDWYGLGEQLRNSQKHLWHWRDWIFDSLATDEGYDQMVTAMLAGDEWQPGNLDTRRATGFLARNYYLFNRTTWLDSTIEHTSKAFLGLTINCAKCHDHKFDPISQVDYYRMRAIFEPHQVRLDAAPGQINLSQNGIAVAFDDHPDAPTHLHIRGNEATPDTSITIAPDIPTLFGNLRISPVQLPTNDWSPGTRHDVQEANLEAAKLRGADEHAAMQARIAADNALLNNAHNEQELSQDAARLEWKAELVRIKQQLKVAEQKHADAPTDATAKAVAEALEKCTALEKRGPAKEHTPVRGSQKALETPEHKFDSYSATYPQTSTGRRLALAQWIVSRDNPLAARVAVNHLWLRTMGEPLVADMADFGLRARSPLHQNVLDFLAVEFMENGWSLQHVLRLITSSHAYQRSSSKKFASSESVINDPENRYFWRANGKRMTAQMLRDAVNTCGDSLNLEMGGTPLELKDSSKRRSVYFRHSRDDSYRFHVPFDDANILECYRRQESIAPQQALALMNDRDVFSACKQIAEREIADGTGQRDFVISAFLRVLGRDPTVDEIASCHESHEALIDDGADEISARTVIVLALMNHNDFVTIR